MIAGGIVVVNRRDIEITWPTEAQATSGRSCFDGLSMSG